MPTSMARVRDSSRDDLCYEMEDPPLTSWDSVSDIKQCGVALAFQRDLSQNMTRLVDFTACTTVGIP